MKRFGCGSRWLAAALAAALFGGGCGGELPIGSILVVASVQVSPSEATLRPTHQRVFAAEGRTSSGIPVTGRDVSWTSSQPGVATVGDDGTVRAMNPGVTRITATIDGVSGTADVTVSLVAVDHVEVTPPAVTLPVGQTTLLDATPYDEDDNALTGREILWSSSQPATASVSDGLVVAHALGTATITATVEGKTANSVVTVTAGPASRLVFAVPPPTTALSGVPLSPSPAVRIADAQGNPVAVAGIQVAATLASGTGTLSGASVVTGSDGVATFSELTITGQAGSYTLEFASPNLTPITSAPIALELGDAALAFVVAPPSAATNGIPLDPAPVIRLLNSSGGSLNQAGVPVTASVASGPEGGAVAGTVTVSTNGQGRATFSNLQLVGPVGSYTLRFSAPGFGAITSGPIALAAGPASRLVIIVQPPATAISGEVLSPSPAVGITDAQGNAVSAAGVQIVASLGSGTGTLSGASATTAANGVATFTELAVSGDPGLYTLSFSSAGLTGVTSTGIVLSTTGGSPSITLAVAPASAATNGEALAPSPVAQLLDPGGAPLAQAGVQVTASVASGPVGGATAGTVTVSTNSQGLATFTNLQLVGPVGSYVLEFAAAGFEPAESGSIALAAGAPAAVVMTTQPSGTAVNDVPFAQQPVVTVQDVGGNLLPDVGVTASIASGPTGTLGGEATVTTNESGVASFSNLEIVGLAGEYTIRFAAGEVSAVSSPVLLAAGTATKLVIIVQPPSSYVLGTLMTPTPQVQLRDSGENPVLTDGVAITVAIQATGSSNAGTFTSESTTIESTASGVATFDNLVIGSGKGTVRLRFSASGLGSVQSNSIEILQ